MKSIHVFMLITSVLISSFQSSYADDLIGKRYSINRVIKSDQKIAFSLCDDKFIPRKCEYIGKISGYSLEELDKVSRSELTGARWKTGGAIVVGVIGFFTGVGFMATTAAGAAAGIVTVGETVSGLVVGGVIGGIPFYLRKLNPIHQFKQAKVLKSDGIYTDMIINLPDEEIFDIAELMKEVLE